MTKKRGDSQCDSVNYGGKILINICLQFKMSEHCIKVLLLIKFDSLDPVFIMKVDYMIFLIYVHPLSEQSIINPYHRLSVDYLLHVVNESRNLDPENHHFKPISADFTHRYSYFVKYRS